MPVIIWLNFSEFRKETIQMMIQMVVYSKNKVLCIISILIIWGHVYWNRFQSDLTCIFEQRATVLLTIEKRSASEKHENQQFVERYSHTTNNSQRQQ